MIISKKRTTIPLLKNILNAGLFGLLSLIFGSVQFNIPIIDGVNSSLSEIPLLISVLYFSNPIYLVIVAVVSGIGDFTWINLMSTVIHATGLMIFWWYYRKYLLSVKDNTPKMIGLAVLGVVIYYFVLVLPLVAIAAQSAYQADSNIFKDVFVLLKSVTFELVATTLVIVLYLLQNNTKNKLSEHLLSLEDKIKQRTEELDKTIVKLNQANEKLKSNNESLDLTVAERTAELKHRNVQLTGYAFVNSHLLRAPLARILGLSNLMKYELSSIDDQELIDKFLLACQELDEVINLLSELLSQESVLSKKELDELQDKIMKLATEIKIAE